MTTATLRGDLAGGTTAAVLTIPVSMSLGALAFSSLGDAYVSAGILSAFVSVVVVAATAALLRPETVVTYGPRAVVASLISATVLPGLPLAGEPADAARVLHLLFAVCFAAGLFQALFGALRLGSLVRYIPAPVMAGFQNAAAVLIVLYQLDVLLGLPERTPLGGLLDALPSAQPLTALVGLVAALATWYTPRVTARMPPPVAGLLLGSAAYYLLAAAGLGSGLGPVVGVVPAMLPSPSAIVGVAGFLVSGEAWTALPSILPAAASLALIASLDSLLCAKLIETTTGWRSDGNREMVGLGVGNMLAACAGGIPSGIYVGSSVANHEAGGRTRLSVLTFGLVVLAAVLFLGPVIGGIPKVAIAGVLLAAGIQLVDRPTLAVAGRLLSGELEHWKSLAADLLVVLLVAGMAMAFDLIVAVGAGVAIAVVTFLFRMSRSVVRRSYRGDTLHSRRLRDPKLMAVLQTEGRRILVLELEGPIFFGTAEDLARRIEEVLDQVDYVVLDLKRVNEIDTTGARILLHLHSRMALAGKHLLLSHPPAGRAATGALRGIGVASALTPERIFVDTDRALEWAEERLIVRHQDGLAPATERGLEEMDLFRDLAPAQLAALRDALERRTYRQGDVVFREGDPGNELFLIARGTASVKIRLPGQPRESRLATFSTGTVFGEIALLDRGPRSATVEADEDLVCHVLTREAFEALARQDRTVAIALLAGLARELSQRLRRSTRAISELES